MDEKMKEIEKRIEKSAWPEALSWDTKEIQFLLSECERLEAERDGYRNGQMQLQAMVNDLMDVNSKWAERVKELENEKLYWNCPTHGEYQNAWGCPQCTVELRTRVRELEGGIKRYLLSYPLASTDELKKLIE